MPLRQGFGEHDIVDFAQAGERSVKQELSRFPF